MLPDTSFKTSILLAMPLNAQFHEIIEKNLYFHGFDVVNLAHYSEGLFRYPNIRVRLQTKFRQIVLRQKDAKTQLRQKLAFQTILNHINQNGKLDYALFIRPDLFPLELVELTRTICPNMVAYQWDGMARFAKIDEYISLFNRFFVFDPHDAQNPKYAHLQSTTNFYFDCLLEKTSNNGKMYFVGAQQKNRQNMIIKFAKYAQQKQWDLDFSIYVWDKQTHKEMKHYPSNIQFIEKTSLFADNLHNVLKSSVLVDFLDNVHHGLSFRSFEALGYRKKLITTNTQIAHYDFYHPHNIYIWDGEHFDGIEEFLAMPYHELSPEIYEKYSFGNWIRYVLDIEPHIKIGLPKI